MSHDPGPAKLSIIPLLKAKDLTKLYLPDNVHVLLPLTEEFSTAEEDDEDNRMAKLILFKIKKKQLNYYNICSIKTENQYLKWIKDYTTENLKIIFKILKIWKKVMEFLKITKKPLYGLKKLSTIV
ncbi:5875_t:CDS:2 [Diversispora eburnea]|uniref:5875_t:CDS:1 n=1 Tax=Diversispora eburnea TaxID=1213867 RepID=A0A9N8ZAE8_9GLOM|nr:5875_t:CDS:2 [Diversispora eburnea]